jgi:hypothetical protein
MKHYQHKQMMAVLNSTGAFTSQKKKKKKKTDIYNAWLDSMTVSYLGVHHGRINSDGCRDDVSRKHNRVLQIRVFKFVSMQSWQILR